MQNECVIIPYHYVHDPKSGLPNVYSKTKKEFKDQLIYLEKKYKIISLRDYFAYLNNEKDISEKTCLLTFDDGLKDHYKNVYPILKKMHLPATFFIPVLPLLKKKVLPVQMLQCLLAKVNIEDFVIEYHNAILKHYPDKIEEYRLKEIVDEKTYLWYDKKTVSLKRAMGKMSFDMQRTILKPLFEKYIGDEEKYWEKLYMNYFDIVELVKHKFEIGCHGYKHQTMEFLSDEELDNELLTPKVYLEEMHKIGIISFSMPYGSYNEKVMEKLKRCGYRCCLNSVFEINKGKTDPFKLTRMDPMFIGDKI